MATYKLEQNEILIYFVGIPDESIRNKMKSLSYRWDPSRKVWHAPFSTEREELARSLSELHNKETRNAVSTEPISDKISIDALVSHYLLLTDPGEQVRLEEQLTRGISSRLDSYVQVIRDYINEEKIALTQKKVKEASIKEDVSGCVLRKRQAEEKRKVLEQIITNYMLSMGEMNLSGQLYNVSYKENFSFSLSPEMEEEIRCRANVPSWVTIDIKLDQRALKKMSSVPDGVIQTAHYKLQTWTDDEGDPGIPSYEVSLNAFLDGQSIDEIREKRGMAWSTIKGHLFRSIEEGLLDIHSYVPDRIMNELEALSSHGHEWKVSDYLRAIKYKLSYDWVSLALTFLKIRDCDD